MFSLGSNFRLTISPSSRRPQFVPILLIQLLNLFWYFLILRIMVRSVESPSLRSARRTQTRFPSFSSTQPRSIRGVTLADDRSDDEDEGEDDEDEVVPSKEEKKTQ